MPTISGTTKDSTGAALAGVTVEAYDVATHSLQGTATSDASGNYTITVPGTGAHYCSAYLDGASFLAGTTRRDLVPVSPPLESVVSVQNLWTGVPTTDGVVLSAKLLNAATSTRVAVSTSSTMSGAVYSSAQAPDATYRHVKHVITGKQPNTEYYYAIEVDGKLDLETKGRFKTLPPVGSAASFSFVTGGCAENTNDAAFTAIAAITPAPLFFLQTGDFQYMDNSNPGPTTYHNAFNVSLDRAGRKPAHSQIPNVYMWDDHDFATNNATGMTSTGAEQTFRAPGLAFYRSRVPAIPASSTTGDTVHYSFVVGRLRFIVSDLRSSKSHNTATDDANKTMMGAAQKTWWKAEIAAAKTAGQAVAWVSGVPWHSASDTDTWFGYSTERTELANYIRDQGMGGKVFVISSDMHALAIKDTVDYATNGGAAMPVFQAGPLNRLSSSKGGPYTFGPFPPATPQVNATQYGIVDVTDDGTTMTVTFKGINAADGAVKMTHSFTPLATASSSGPFAPAQMAKPTVTAGNGQATVTLVAPSDGGSPITKYELGGLPAGAIDQQAGTTALVRTVTGLTNGQAVTTLTARAVNNVGNGPYSPAADPFTPIAPSASGFDATGGTITTPGDGYKYWTFTTNDTLTVTAAGDVEYLVVGGGGGGSSGGSSTGGGGGAGGLKQGTLSLAAQAYAITVGAGGTGTSGAGTNGGNSSIAALVEALGGGAGGQSANLAKVGGSGGGGNSTTNFTAGAAGTSGQGNSGGNGFESTTAAERAGGGGGGAGGPGVAGAINKGGNGGPGVAVWGNRYAGGGGGAAAIASPDSAQGAGVDGGGTGLRVATASSKHGTANTGGGGGGGTNTQVAGNGGSGIVILRRAI